MGALEKNIHAITIGEKSHGKGVAQKFVELTDGSALFITYAQIILPDGTKYDKYGIEPKIISVKELLQIENLVIPNYQRPYKWTEKVCRR